MSGPRLQIDLDALVANWRMFQRRVEPAYAAAVVKADAYGLGAATVAFPAISAGVYGWPMDDAARIAVSTVRATHTKVAEVRFVLFSPAAYAAFTEQG